MQVKTVQYGLGTKGHRSRMNGDWVSGPETLSRRRWAANRYDLGDAILAHPLDDDYYKAMVAGLVKDQGAAAVGRELGRAGRCIRAAISRASSASASKQKWLEVHGIEHWTHYYTDYGVDLQKRFFGYFLKGEKNGWDKQPQVQLNVRHPGEKFVERHEDDWPIPRTQWTKFHLATERRKLATAPRRRARQRDIRRARRRRHLPHRSRCEKATEITGPVAAKLRVSSSTEDADIFLVLRVFAPDMKEVVFQGALDPHTPIGQGWLRASHRKLDKKLTLPFGPITPTTRSSRSSPARSTSSTSRSVPTSIVVPKGYRVGLERARARLCLSRRLGRQALQHEERVHRQRSVPARRPARPADCDLRRQDHNPYRRWAGKILLLPIIPDRRKAKPPGSQAKAAQDRRTSRVARQIDPPPLAETLKRFPD